MIIYMNYKNYVFVLPHEALEVMGRPNFLTFLTSVQTNRVIIIPLKSRRTDIGIATIPDVVYRNNAAYAVRSMSDFREQMFFFADVSGQSSYAIKAEPTILDDLKAGSVGNLSRSLQIKGMALDIDMMSAESATVDIGRIYTVGGYVVP